jgi:hypothetical protein
MLWRRPDNHLDADGPTSIGEETNRIVGVFREQQDSSQQL